MNSYERDPVSGHLVMICQVCNKRCHGERPVRVEVPDPESVRQGKPVYRIVECRQCICHDCVQLSDNPLLAEIAPLMLGQTMEAGQNKLADGSIEKRPGPFSIEKALPALARKLGLLGKPSQPKRIAQSRHCADCGHPAKTRCLDCNGPLCGKCVEGHHCSAEERF